MHKLGQFLLSYDENGLENVIAEAVKYIRLHFSKRFPYRLSLLSEQEPR